MQVTVVFDLNNAEDAAAFDAARAAVGGSPATDAPKQTRTRKTANAEPEAPKQPEAPPTPKHTLEQLRAMVPQATDEGVAKSEIKALLQELGAAKVPDLDPANYDEFATRLQKLVEDAL